MPIDYCLIINVVITYSAQYLIFLVYLQMSRMYYIVIDKQTCYHTFSVM